MRAGSSAADRVGDPDGSVARGGHGDRSTSAGELVGAADVDLVTVLLGRRPAARFRVVRRGAGGVPAVIENVPFCDDGRPMPTRYWLVDPGLVAAVGRLEATGGVRLAERAVDPVALEDAHRRYAALRSAAVPRGHPRPWPSGGVGGTRVGVKCLHAHLAWHLAGGADPVGSWVVAQLEESGAAAALRALGPLSGSDREVAPPELALMPRHPAPCSP